MSPLNRGPLLGPRVPPPAGMRPPMMPRLANRPPPPPGMPPRMPPPLPMGPMFGPMRQRMPPPQPRPGMPRPPPLFGPRARGGVPPLMHPMLGGPMRPPMGPRGMLPLRPGPRGMLPPPPMSMRPRFMPGNGNVTGKTIKHAKKAIKLEELELKKPWMTDEIRSEVQKKNKLYAKAKKNKDAKEWEEFKDLRNKVTRMIRDAKNEYLTKHPEQASQYPDDEEPYDQRDENYESSEEEEEEEEDPFFFCEVCDREFTSEERLRQHNEEHQTCGIDGCTFFAHPLLVEKHINMQHRTGLYKRMGNLSTPEDIEKWINERKRKYPTVANTELKKAKLDEMVERGEIVEERTTGLQKKLHRDPKHKDRKRKRSSRKRKGGKNKIEEAVIVESENYRGLRPFPGIAILDSRCPTEEEASPETGEIKKIKDNVNISDDEDLFPAAPSQSRLFSLVADYGSDSNNEEQPEEAPIKQIKCDDKLLDLSKIENTEVEPPDEVPIVKTHPENNEKLEENPCKIIKPTRRSKENNRESFGKQQSKVETSDNKKSQPQPNKKSRNKRLDLLERLLSRDIQHERNLVCQCIKYIADNNFLDVI